MNGRSMVYPKSAKDNFLSLNKIDKERAVRTTEKDSMFLFQPRVSQRCCHSDRELAVRRDAV